MREIQAPTPVTRADLFLAGGIMGAPHWQRDALARLAAVPGSVFNPRREQAFTPDMHEAQVTWEFHALNAATAILFWFPCETLCPITLFELGARSRLPGQPIFVGAHPAYARRADIGYQLGLTRPEVVVHDTLEATVDAFITWQTGR